MALYLTHEKCSDKVQYDWRDVLEFGGANWHDWCNELEDLHAMMKEMRQYIIANNVAEFYEFQLWCDENNDMWSRALDLARGQSGTLSSGGATLSSKPRNSTTKTSRQQRRDDCVRVVGSMQQCVTTGVESSANADLGTLVHGLRN